TRSKPSHSGSSSIATRSAMSGSTARHATSRQTEAMSIDRGLAKTRGGFLSRLFGRTSDRPVIPVTPEWLDELAEALLRSDISVSLVDSVMLQVRDVVA